MEDLTGGKRNTKSKFSNDYVSTAKLGSDLQFVDTEREGSKIRKHKAKTSEAVQSFEQHLSAKDSMYSPARGTDTLSPNGKYESEISG